MNLNTQSKTRQVWTDETQSGAGPETLVYRSADHERRRLVVFVGTLLFLLLLVRTAWTSDDAYITFRTIDNFLHGFGLRWNVANRVQAYTHPLWMWTIAAAVALTREYYYTSIVISMAVSGLTVALLAGRLAASVPMALLALSCVLLSQAFVDYSTSSLENPLFHLLLVAVLIVDNSRLAPPRPLLVLTLLASLLMLTRLDTGLLVLPLLVVRAKEQPFTRAFRTVAIGLLPLVAWEAFSLVYYGSLFPNTAYSKLRTGVAESELAYQGFLYLLDAMHRDVLTVLVL